MAEITIFRPCPKCLDTLFFEATLVDVELNFIVLISTITFQECHVHAEPTTATTV